MNDESVSVERTMEYYVEGEWCEEGHAKISVTDRGLLYGDGGWESVGIWEGRLIHLDDHLARLYRSLLMLKLDFAMPPDELRSLIVGAPALLILTMPRGDDSEQPWRGGGTRRALSAVFSTYTRPTSTTFEHRIKSLSYITSVMAEIEAQEQGADMAILRNTLGYVAEGHAMNVFSVREGTVFAPSEGDGGLAGVTRSRVLQTARTLGFPCAETNLTPYDFRCADEAFISSASAGIHGIASIDGREFPVPAPGPVTSAVRAAYVEAAWEEGTVIPDPA
jgi:branched-chain amino acid aminotransferase